MRRLILLLMLLSAILWAEDRDLYLVVRLTQPESKNPELLATIAQFRENNLHVTNGEEKFTVKNKGTEHTIGLSLLPARDGLFKATCSAQKAGKDSMLFCRSFTLKINDLPKKGHWQILRDFECDFHFQLLDQDGFNERYKTLDPEKTFPFAAAEKSQSFVTLNLTRKPVWPVDDITRIAPYIKACNYLGENEKARLIADTLYTAWSARPAEARNRHSALNLLEACIDAGYFQLAAHIYERIPSLSPLNRSWYAYLLTYIDKKAEIHAILEQAKEERAKELNGYWSIGLMPSNCIAIEFTTDYVRWHYLYCHVVANCALSLAKARMHAQALAEVESIKNEGVRINTISELLPLLPAAIAHEQACKIPDMIKDVHDRKHADIMRTTYLPEQNPELEREKELDGLNHNTARYARTLTRVAKYFTDKSDKENGKAFLERAIQTADIVSLSGGQAGLRTMIAEQYIALGMTREAEAVLERALECAELTEMDYETLLVFRVLKVIDSFIKAGCAERAAVVLARLEAKLKNPPLILTFAERHVKTDQKTKALAIIMKALENNGRQFEVLADGWDNVMITDLPGTMVRYGMPDAAIQAAGMMYRKDYFTTDKIEDAVMPLARFEKALKDSGRGIRAEDFKYFEPEK